MLDVLSESPGLFRVCQSLLTPECVEKPELGETVFTKYVFMACFSGVYRMRQSSVDDREEECKD